MWLLVPALAWAWWLKGVEYPPGVVVPESPEQREVAGLVPLLKAGFQIQPLAEYKIRARLLGRAHYWFDPGSDLAPLDLAVGWGSMSDQAVLDRLYWTQSWRFLNWHSRKGDWPIPFEELNSHSANMHIVPATAAVLAEIGMARTGQIINMSGYLIEATGAQGAKWRSSLSRTDEGAGACELMWVTEFTRE